MAQMTATEARNNFSEALDKAQEMPLHIKKNGKTVAILISPSLYEDFIEAEEELEDIRDIDAVLNDPNEKWMLWEQVRKDLGLE